MKPHGRLTDLWGTVRLSVAEGEVVRAVVDDLVNLIGFGEADPFDYFGYWGVLGEVRGPASGSGSLPLW